MREGGGLGAREAARRGEVDAQNTRVVSYRGLHFERLLVHFCRVSLTVVVVANPKPRVCALAMTS